MKAVWALAALVLLAASADAQAAIPPLTNWPAVQSVAAYPSYKEGEVRVPKNGGCVRTLPLPLALRSHTRAVDGLSAALPGLPSPSPCAPPPIPLHSGARQSERAHTSWED